MQTSVTYRFMILIQRNTHVGTSLHQLLTIFLLDTSSLLSNQQDDEAVVPTIHTTFKTWCIPAPSQTSHAMVHHHHAQPIERRTHRGPHHPAPSPSSDHRNDAHRHSKSYDSIPCSSPANSGLILTDTHAVQTQHLQSQANTPQPPYPCQHPPSTASARSTH